MMTTTDPWTGISVPAVNGQVSARRADPAHPYGFYWAKDFAGNCALVLAYSADAGIKIRMPKLQEIDFSDSDQGNGKRSLSLMLHSLADKEIFYRLCQDIIESTSNCNNEGSAVAVFIQRSWRWHRMLKSAAEERLGAEAQKGLIGELWFIKEFLLKRYSPSESLDFWLGPENSPKDFAIGNTAVEVKARRGAAKPFVSISSEHQLDSDSVDVLYLFVININAESAETSGAFNLHQMVQEMKALIELADLGAVGQLEAKLSAAGYYDEHDYNDRYWIIGGFQFFEVREGFPRISGSSLPSGVRDVSYALELNHCQSYLADSDLVRGTIGGLDQ